MGIRKWHCQHFHTWYGIVLLATFLWLVLNNANCLALMQLDWSMVLNVVSVLQSLKLKFTADTVPQSVEMLRTS